jgi:uncharacterized protein YbaR (Trm112 family)
MFVIFGWNHQIVNNIGPVLPQVCPNCKNDEFWHLLKISTWFTLFFIPVFPYENNRLIMCPVCKEGLKIDADTYTIYKSIAEINIEFSEKRITESERITKMEEYFKILEEKNNSLRVRQLEESKDFTQQVESKPNHELIEIFNGDRDKYNPAFLFAVEEELSKRGIKPEST